MGETHFGAGSQRISVRGPESKPWLDFKTALRPSIQPLNSDQKNSSPMPLLRLCSLLGSRQCPVLCFDIFSFPARQSHQDCKDVYFAIKAAI